MTGYLEERPGVKSNIRLMSTLCLFASFGAALITLMGWAPDTKTGLIVIGLFLVAAFCPKVIQKFAEALIITKFPAGEAQVNSADAPNPYKNGHCKPETINRYSGINLEK